MANLSVCAMNRFALSLFLFLLAASRTHALEETFPPLKQGKAPRSFEEMWGGFDARAEPLETEVLAEWEEEGVVLRVVRYRVGVFKGHKAMLAAIYGFPKEVVSGGKKIPGLVQIHGGGQSAHYRVCLLNAKRGYASVSLAWAGRLSAPSYHVGREAVKLYWEEKTDDPRYRVTTDWGVLDAYHAPGRNPGSAFPSVKPAPWTLDKVESPRNSGWFLCAVAARRALTFLEQQPEVDGQRLGVYGHSMGGKLTVMASVDSRVKAAAPSCGGISDRDNSHALYRTTLGDNVSLERISCPIIFLSPANDFHGRIGDLHDAVQEIKSRDWRLVCSPHHNHQDSAHCEVGTMLWFDQHLQGTFTFPDSPAAVLRADAPARMIRAEVTIDEAMPVREVDTFYTQQGKRHEKPSDIWNTIHRYWHHAETKDEGELWSCEVPLGRVDHPLWVYTNAEYSLRDAVSGAGYYYGPYTAKSFVLSSPLVRMTPGELAGAGVRPALESSLLIEDFEGDWEKGWFTYSPERWSRTTHKLYEPLWKAPAGARLAFRVRAAASNRMVVIIDHHASEVDLAGTTQAGPDEGWQDVVLDAKDFKDLAGEELAGWQGIKRLTLGYGERLRPRHGSKDTPRLLARNWQGPPPEFRNLRWVVREVPPLNDGNKKK